MPPHLLLIPSLLYSEFGAIPGWSVPDGSLKVEQMSDTQRAEAVVLMLGYEATHKTDQGYLFAASDVVTKVKAYTISEEEGRAALDRLVAEGLFRAVGDPVAWTTARATLLGFRRYTMRFMPEYPDTKRSVATKIREGKTIGDLIARSLGQTVKLVDWTLKDLKAEGHIELSGDVGQPLTVSRIFPSLDLL